MVMIELLGRQSYDDIKFEIEKVEEYLEYKKVLPKQYFGEPQ